MLQAFTIKTYRKFDDISFHNLRRFNFFVGDNNMGKTSILEAIYGWACGFNLQPFIVSSVMRNYPMTQMTPYSVMDILRSVMNEEKKVPWHFSFSGIENEEEITYSHTITPSAIITELNSHIDMIKERIHIADQEKQVIANWDIALNANENKTYQISLPFFIPLTEPQQTAKYIDILGHRNPYEAIRIYSALKKEGLMHSFINDLQKIFPDIQAIDTFPYPDATQAPIVLKTAQRGFLPLYAFGDGVQRWYHILGSLTLYKKAMLCIDEVDVTLHHAAQKEFCTNLIQYARKYQAQLFLTTHNLEFLDYFLESWHELEQVDDVCITTLAKNRQQVKIRSLSGADAYRARQYNMELR